VFQRNGDEWVEVAKLVGSEAELVDLFGHSVDADDGLAVIGAPGARKAYAFENSGDSWVETDRLLTSAPPEELGFGSAVALDLGRIAVGESATFDADGAVYVFERIGPVWETVAEVRGPGRFGHTIDMSGSRLVVGAPGPNDAEAGAAFAFTGAELPPIEAGRVAVNHEWTSVLLEQPFADPVVVVGPASWSGHQPLTIRVRNVAPTGFELRLDEWDYLDGRHVVEEVGYVVVERGEHVLPGGTRVIAGSVATNATRSPAWIEFETALAAIPAVFTSVVTDGGGDAVVTRVDAVSTSGFEVLMQEQEANRPWHVAEQIDYVVWEFGVGGGTDPFGWEVLSAAVSHQFTPVVFTGTYFDACVVADMNTMAGGDSATLRWRSLAPSTIELQVDEEQSDDWELWHRSETVSVLVIECE
jgi:hypothetical protein